MPLQIVRDDITKMRVDAIVNAADASLLGGGGVDGQIHRAAGPSLLEECRKLGGCPPGQARRTGAGNLPCKYVIHTVGPRWTGGNRGEEEILRSCYQNSLALALEAGCETVAFPLIASGVFGYPRDQALRTAADAIGDFLSREDMTVFLVIFDARSFRIGQELYDSISAFIDDQYAGARTETPAERIRRQEALLWEQTLEDASPAPPSAAPAPPASPAPPAATPAAPEKARRSPFPKLRRGGPTAPQAARAPQAPAPPPPMAGAVQTVQAQAQAQVPLELDRALAQLDESFSQMLLRKIDESGMTDAQFYRRANMDRKLFSKIRGNVQYRPSKPTAVASAIALELSLEETRELLMKAGFALSRSSKFDVIVEFFIRQGNYSILQLNEALFAFDQVLLGA